MSGTLLPIPDDPRLPAILESWPASWTKYRWPRSAWLGLFEAVLREHYPQANSDSLTLTSRSVAPFPLARPNEP